MPFMIDDNINFWFELQYSEVKRKCKHAVNFSLSTNEIYKIFRNKKKSLCLILDYMIQKKNLH